MINKFIKSAAKVQQIFGIHKDFSKKRQIYLEYARKIARLERFFLLNLQIFKSLNLQIFESSNL